LVEAAIRIALSGRRKLLSVSDGVEALLGYKPKEFLSSNVSLADRIHPNDADVAKKLFSSNPQEISGAFNLRIRHADGRIRCVRAYRTMDTAPNGKPALNLTFQDAKSLKLEMADQKSSVNLRAVMESVDECVYFKDRNHVITEANLNYRRALSDSDAPLRVLAGLTDYDLYPEEVADGFYGLEKQIFAGMPWANEIQESVDSEGKKVWTEIRKYPVKDADGEIIGIFGIARVVSDRVLAENALYESEDFLKESQKVAGLGSYVYDVVTGNLKSSDVLDEIFGIDKIYEHTLEGWKRLIHPDERATVSAQLADVILGDGKPCDMEYRIIRQDDHAERWVHGIGRLEFDAHGKALVMRGTIQDITERKLADKALRESEASLREAQQIATLGSFILDVPAGTWSGSDVLYETLGIDKSCEHTVEGWIKLLYPEDVVGLSAQFAATAMQKGMLFDNECRFIRQTDQAMRWVHLLGRMEVDPEGRPIYLRGTIQDITERKLAQATLHESKELLRLFIEHAPAALAMFDREMRYLAASRRWNEDYGLNSQEIVGYSHYEIFPEIPDRWRESHRRALAGETIQAGADSFERSDGSVLWLRWEVRPWRTGGGEIGGIVIFSEDITHQTQAEERLHLAASVFTHASEGIIITDTKGAILDVNEAFARITGYTREEVLGQNPRLLNSGRQSKEFYAEMWNQLAAKGQWSGEIWNRAKDGRIYPEVLTIRSVPDATGKTQQYVALFADISSLKEQEQKLERHAHYDLLTGLPNRVLLAERLQEAMPRGQRKGRPMAIVCLDLDNFKAINEHHGRDFGDQLLKVMASRIGFALRQDDMLARIGGDEFVAVLVELANTNDSIPMLTRLVDAVSEPAQVGELTLQISTSIGVTFFPQPGDVDADQLLRQAGQAMYQAKLEGKNRYFIFDPLADRSARGRHEYIERIRHALKGDEFVLYYQPKVNMSSGKVLGAEALIRWQHPEAGLLSPVQFLPVVEGHPLNVELGEWVINSALTQMERWRADGLDIPVSVNIDGQQLQEPDFIERLSALLAAHPGVPPSSLELEVLESSALQDMTQVSKVIAACSEIGVSFALDDFGTGYSTLAYLRRLPASVLKIDRSFVRDMLSDPEDLTILEGVLALVTAFRRKAIAEGVETVEQGLMLLRLGCQVAQGYGIARPMPASDLPEWAARWRPHPMWANVTAVDPVDAPLLYAAVEHRAWIVAIEEFLRDHRSTAPVQDPLQCRLGAWMNAEVSAGRGDRPGLNEIDAVHQRIHGLASDVMALKGEDKTTEATAGLAELHALRDTLLEKLHDLVQGS